MKKFLILFALLPLIAFGANIKTQGDANLGSLTDLEEDDILYVSRDPHTSGNEGYITGANLSKLGGNAAVYNALTDPGSSVVADYTDALNPGTDQRANIIAWIEGNGLPAGKKRFYFPPGHYLIGEGVGNDTTVLDINGYDGVEIFGAGIGETVFHSPYDHDLKYKNNSFIRVGWTVATERVRIHGISFVTDLYMTNSEQSVVDNDIYWGWLYFPTWSAGVDVNIGDRLMAGADDFVYEYQNAGTTGGTEPTGTTDNGMTLTKTAIANWVGTGTAYTAGDYAKFISTSAPDNAHAINAIDQRSLARAANSGTSAAGSTEPSLSLPSGDGSGGDNAWSWISLNLYSKDCAVYDSEFTGLMGFSQAGGNGISMNSNATTGLHHIHHNWFHDFQYGTGLVGYYHSCLIEFNRFERTGGWLAQYGTFNAHCIYAQGGRNRYLNNFFDSHYYGIQLKIHTNVDEVSGMGNIVQGNTFLNNGYAAMQVFTDQAANSHLDFVDPATSTSDHSGNPVQGQIITGNFFQQQKSVYDNWIDGGTPDGYAAIIVDSPGVNASNNTFIDIGGVFGRVDNSFDFEYSNATVEVMASNCVFRCIYNKKLPFVGAVHADNWEIDFRAITFTGTGVLLDNYASLTNSRVFARQADQTDRSSHLITVSGDHCIVANNVVTLDGTGSIIGSDALTNLHSSIHDNHFLAPSGSLYWYPETDGQQNWIWEGNYWDISAWAASRAVHAGGDQIFRNERGNLWGQDDILGNTGTVRIVSAATWLQNANYLVNELGVKVTAATPAEIYGMSRFNGGDNTPFWQAIAVDEHTHQWCNTDAQVTLGDWAKLSAGTAGKIAPNGTTGSTTKPTTGFIGLITNVGTAGAGAGIAQVEIVSWNK